MDKDAMKQKLLQMREQLQMTAATRDGSAQVVELDQSKVGRLSRMDAMQDQDIAPKRLDVDPTALLCITCASAEERR